MPEFYDDPGFDLQLLSVLDSIPIDPEVFNQGAVPGFAVKREHSGAMSAPKRVCIRPAGKEQFPDKIAIRSTCTADSTHEAATTVPSAPSNIHKMPHPQLEEAKQPYHEQVNQADDPNKSPSLPDAMPLPRLGCGGPTPAITTEVARSAYEQGLFHNSEPGPTVDNIGEDTSPEHGTSPTYNKAASRSRSRETKEVEPHGPNHVSSPEACDDKGLPMHHAQPDRETCNQDELMIQIKLIIAGGSASDLQVPEGSTVQKLIHLAIECTNNQVQAVTDTIGRSIHLDKIIEAGEVFVLHGPCSNQVSEGTHIPCLRGATREALLWKQGGFVAVDEMEYYMHMLECYQPTTVFGLLELQKTPQHERSAVLADFVVKVIADAGTDPNSSVKAFMVHHNNHWSPCVAKVQGPDISLSLTPADYHWMHPMIKAVLGDEIIHINQFQMPTAFAADCGFQAIGWILSILLQEPTDVPFSGEQAIQWRQLFHKDLVHTDKASEFILQPLTLGGTQTITEKLQTLVVAHGVAEQRGKECAEQLIQALGTTSIHQILQSPKPWADLKARANMHQPPIRVVLASELKVLIQQKAGLTQIGSKANKTKSKQLKKTPLQLRADQLEIPHGVFKQSDGELLGQISAAKIAPNTTGVALANIQEVLPFFSLTAPISQTGVALLIIEHDDTRLPEHCQVMKVPALCQDTKDPLIIKVAVLQLGHLVVTRNTPLQAIAVPEVPNAVVRILIYKDQYQGNWSEFVKSPVRTMMKQPPFVNLQQHEIIDVWDRDRQFMTNRMTRTSQEESVMFSVNMRVSLDVQDDIFLANGANGTYVEPRSPDGRQPAEQFQVVWLPRKTYSEAQVCQQTSKVSATLVRQCDRYGLRVESSHAEELHRIHRPDLVYIPGVELAKYRVGPMPFGTTKQSLVHVFTKWKWQARPLAPQGQARDRSGVMWLVQAAEPPSHWIFQLSHGDVLVSPEEKGPAVQEPSQAVLASSKTIQALQSKSAPSTVEDPWIHHDPWQATRPSTRELSTGQVTAMESRIEQSLLNKLRPDDAEMVPAPDDKVQALEARLDQLSTTVANHQHEMQRQQQAVQNQIHSLDMKVDQQQGFFQNTLETKLEQQMQRIEQLFGKRQRTNE
jgi:hypothetical protein